MEQTLGAYTKALIRRQNHEMAWGVLGRNFSGSAPRRFVAGIAVSSKQKNANGQAFDPNGALALQIPMPLLWDHNFCRPVGKVTGVSVRGDALHFTAEICNGGLSSADQVWYGLVKRLQHGVSIGPFDLYEDDGFGGHFRRWGLEEITIAEAGADPDARILRVWERSNVVHLHRPSETVYWSE